MSPVRWVLVLLLVLAICVQFFASVFAINTEGLEGKVMRMSAHGIISIGLTAFAAVMSNFLVGLSFAGPG